MSAPQLASHALTGIMANSAAVMAVLANTGKLHLLFLIVHRLDAYKLTLHLIAFPAVRPSRLLLA